MVKKEYRLKGNPTQGLIGATFGFFIGFAAVALYGPAAKNFKEIMGLTGVMMGILVAIPQLTGSLLRIPFGAWVDKVGGKKPFVVLFVLSLIGMSGLTFILINYYPDRMDLRMYPFVLLFGVLSGCGVATFSVGIPQTSYWFPKSKQGLALGAYAGLGNTAPGFFTILLPIALSTLGLPKAYALWFIILLTGTIIYVLIAQDAYYFQLIKQGYSRQEAIEISTSLGQELIPSGALVDALKKSAMIGRTWALVLLYFTSFGGFLALTTWFPSYWSIFHGVSIKTAGLLTALCFSLLASFIRVFGGAVSDRIGGEVTSIISFFIVLLGALILMFSYTFTPSLIGEILIGTGMGIANAAVFKLVPKYVPEAIGGASGWIGGLGAFGGFIVPPILGIFLDIYGRTGYAKGFIVYAILALVCIIISFYIIKRYSKA
uniref:MFS transporter, NNP family, nitrate/nitrite transporter n=1 Tax=uncultured prokaryote TaxID=198431 RepID=H5SEM3_9ZZZZ|nr:MFS transporter, NNP family, nitrate/nitrite transporter [uncultured prokaryote]